MKNDSIRTRFISVRCGIGEFIRIMCGALLCWIGCHGLDIDMSLHISTYYTTLRSMLVMKS